MRNGLSQLTLLRELSPVVKVNLDRHRGTAARWEPSDFVEPEQYRWLQRSTLSETAKAALVTNLLAEDNVPIHSQGLADVGFARDPWSDWVREWSIEEARHATAIQQYLVATRSVDPVALERARLQCSKIGIESPREGDHLLRSIAQVTLDELAAVECHRNTVAECNDPAAERLLGRIVDDKNLHITFYRSVASAALDLAPAQTVKAITEVIMNFQMPGTNLPGFGRSAMLIARDGIYDLRSHLDRVVLPLLSAWGIFDRTDLGVGTRSRDVLADFVDDLGRQADAGEQTRNVRRALEAERVRAS